PLDQEVHVAALEVEAGVAGERPVEQARLAGDLKAVADAEHRPAALGEFFDRRHHRRLRRHGADAQIVAVGESAGQHHRVAGAERRLLVPDEARVRAHHALQNMERVVVAVGPGKLWDGDFHSISYRYSSMTVLASSFSHMSFNFFSAVARSPSSTSSMYLPI